MDIIRAQKIAKNRISDAGNGEWNRKFILITARGDRLSCEWVDPYLGILHIDGNKGVVPLEDLPRETKVEVVP